MTKRLNKVLLALLLLIGGPIYWLLLDTSPWNVEARSLSIAQLRQMADQIPGQKPVNVQMELAAWRLVPGDIFAAGNGLKRRMIGIMGFVLEVPGAGPLVIDTGITPAIAAEMKLDKFDAPGQQRIDAQVRRASLILVTHEHGDHLGGLAALASGSNGLSILSHARLNPNQVPSGTVRGMLPWSGKLKIEPTITENGPQAVAPGVVVIPAPSHTPGSQLIFVRLASGAEYLFTGDIATLAVSWQQLRPRSRLVTDILAPEDRRATLSWLKAIARLKREAPALHVVPGHDFDWLVDPRSHSGVKRLPLPQPANQPDKEAGT